ncbi:anthranilate phosphoribosyltransferase [Pelagibius sp. Alg239-R121]|uniref:anthranilate phosphoribosyltransferase n=1 Tax=Pelagibius sp. Alg239-R121 TaxID=2993448 RepID=UPI002AC31211|nr:anthranilate phosphoribosyltransferase [Pelagibius sp. Alg239-R121]
MNGDMNDLKGLIAQVATGRPLSSLEAETAFGIMMSGNATPSQMGGFLMALRVRGETVEELTGAVRAMRAKMLTVDGPDGAIDTCGTGGDAKGTLNISTASSFVIAACGVAVAKHGNRALSSKSGAADVLTALGVNIEAEVPLMEKSLREVGTCFLMAPRHHSAMRHVGPTRVELGTRTIFNLLGPLSNPARIKHQIIGVFAPEWVEPLAKVLKSLGHEKAWVVHGADGLDELSTTGVSCVAELNNGEIRTFEVTPEEAGLPRGDLKGLLGGDADHNATALRAMLNGEAGAFRDAVLLGSAGGLIVANKVANLKEGVEMAAEAIDSGAAAKVLADLIEITNSGHAA